MASADPTAAPSASTLPPLSLALLGNRNVGKTTLFNALTGLRQRTGNYPGVTVERREGQFEEGGRAVRALDLPGLASLLPRSPDERIASEVLTGRLEGVHRPDVVVVVVDATQLRRGLFILSQVLEIGVPVVVALNMVDEARRCGLDLRAASLSEALGGLPVVPTVALTGVGLEDLRRAVVARAEADPQPEPAAPPPIEGVESLPPPSAERWWALREQVEAAGLEDSEVQARWAWVRERLDRAHLLRTKLLRRRSDRVDRVLLHALGGPLFFLGVMGVLFQAVFSLAEPPMEAIEAGTEWLTAALRPLLGDTVFSAMLLDGVLAGVGGVLLFLPQILILFFFIGLLEDTGYMTRAAVLADRPLRLVGLGGQSFIPLLSSFACAIPGVMATRTITSPRERLLTILVAPLMTCSARLPVYAILIGAFIPDRRLFGLGFLGLQGLVLLGLYVGGILLAALAARLLHRYVLRGRSGQGVLELPPYRRPRADAILMRLRHRTGSFLRRAGTVILALSILVWAAVTFPGPPAGAPESASPIAYSAAGRLSRALEPVWAPMGSDWRVGIGVLGSFAAREVFVSTMGVVYAVEEDDEAGIASGVRNSLSLPGALALLVFFMIALQCVSTVAVTRQETGSWGWAAAQFVALGVLAWGAAVGTFQLASLAA